MGRHIDVANRVYAGGAHSIGKDSGKQQILTGEGQGQNPACIQAMRSFDRLHGGTVSAKSIHCPASVDGQHAPSFDGACHGRKRNGHRPLRDRMGGAEDASTPAPRSKWAVIAKISDSHARRDAAPSGRTCRYHGAAMCQDRRHSGCTCRTPQR